MTQIADPKLAKILTRFTSKVDQGDYYEAHQTLRTVVNRYVRSKKWQDAVDLITVGVKSFINAGQSAEAADMTLYLLEVYEQGKVKCSEESIARLAQILTAMDSEEPMLKNIVTAINNWSVNHGTHRYGDPSLHAIMGRRLFEAGHLYEAERYLMLGTRESAVKYANLMFEWYVQSQAQEDVGAFFSRLVLNYLGIFNIKYALDASTVFLEAFIEKEAPRYEKIEKKFASIYFFEDYSELNFLQLLIVACQSKQANYFKSLTGHYSEFANVKYKEEMKNIGRMYFNIRSKSEANMLGNMMEGFFNNL